MIHHFIRKDMYDLMKTLDEKKITYKSYTTEDGTFGIVLGDFDTLWYIDITEYLVPTYKKTGYYPCVYITGGLSVLTSFDGLEKYYTTYSAEETMQIIKEFFTGATDNV